MILFPWQLCVNVLCKVFFRFMPNARSVYHCLLSDWGYCTVSMLWFSCLMFETRVQPNLRFCCRWSGLQASAHSPGKRHKWRWKVFKTAGQSKWECILSYLDQHKLEEIAPQNSNQTVAASHMESVCLCGASFAFVVWMYFREWAWDVWCHWCGKHISSP